MSEIKSLLEKLSNAHGISGWEGSVQEIVSGEIAHMWMRCGSTALAIS